MRTSRAFSLYILGLLCSFLPAQADHLHRIVKDGKWGYIDPGGNVVIKPKYFEAGPFSNGIAAVKDWNWGAIDRTGKFIIPTDWADEISFSGDLARVKKMGLKKG